MNKIAKLSITLIVSVVICSILLVLAMIYIRTGDYLYSKENLIACRKYSLSVVKESVLESRLKHYGGWPSFSAASQAADKAGIVFLDGEIQLQMDIWMVPFTQPNTEGVKIYNAMLDCGTLVVEYSAET